MSSSSSRSLINRAIPFIISRIRQNNRILHTRYFSSSSTQPQPQPLSEPQSSSSSESIHMTDSFVRRMKELQADEDKEKMLRLSIEAGGCSGFQYNFTLDDKTNSDDRIFERDGVKLVVDKISYDFVKGSTVDYVEELIRSAFQVASNPSAVGGCSCKSSFMIG
ncbi:iron-sulfur assembly protein IscA-like 2, mitochondrial [Heracleum sosnowskyi]|uniref:Iron-sulfur assembly protein IscA-like 2, mitochondrial n=1 Tax=Heracleum sosnowskyi TaxID=360622 RepID=A0AAD8JFW9_9APIA|nr:iron-sulfur assembly protein IscA-like 2, mitochondrial [Heracleum sosnowskyi]